MSARSWLLAVAGTALIIFVLPPVLGVLGVAPNGREIMLLVVLLWVGSWVLGRRWAPNRTGQ